MTILFLHGWQSSPGGVKPTFLAQQGHTVLNPALPDEDFEEAVRVAQAEFDKHQPMVIVGSSRGGAVAMNMDSGDVPLVLLCPAWKKYGTATAVKKDTTILHARADDVVPFTDSEELVENSGLPGTAIAEVGNDHRLADPQSLEQMLRVCLDACVPEWTDNEEELFHEEWGGLCYLAAMRWITVAEEFDWMLIHGSVWSNECGTRIDHAWCERGEFVVDLTRPVGARIVGREQYYRVLKAEISKKYSSDDALSLSVKNGHHGPWDESEQLEE